MGEAGTFGKPEEHGKITPEKIEMQKQKTEATNNKLNLIDDLLVHKGLSASVGPTALARGRLPFPLTRGAPVLTFRRLTGEVQDFIGGVEQVISQETLDTLINVKARGATFGALSDSERAELKSSATKLGTWTIKNRKGEVLGYNIDEGSFKKELANIRDLSQKALMRSTIGDNEAEERIDVIGPDGTQGSIPKSQLEEALNEGYSQL